MRPSKPALPEWARPQDLAPTVENARRLGLPQAARPETSHSPSAERPQAPLPPVENLYAPAHGFYQERMRMATQGMMDPDASWMDRAVYAALGLGVTPLAMVEALGTEAYNSLNNASLAGQYWSRGEMAANASDANVARLQAALHGAAAMNGLLGPAALTRPGIPEAAELAQHMRKPAATLPTGNIAFNSGGDRLFNALGPARINNRHEYEQIMSGLRRNGVEVSFRTREFAYGPASSSGKPGNMVIDPDASIAALRHEYGHYLDDAALGFPGSRYYLSTNPRTRVASERRQYLQEIRLARILRDDTARRELIRDYLSERAALIERFYEKPYGTRWR